MDGIRLILNDGTILEGGSAGLSEGFLWLWFGGMTMQEAAVMVFDTARMSRIIFQYGEMENVYEGYTNCTDLSIDRDGIISVCMVKG